MSYELSKNEYDGVVFDLDGVITDTAEVHAKAWKTMFDEYLRSRSDLGEKARRPFEIDTDYRIYVDGKPRYEGVRSFLESRGISIPYGDPDDPPGEDTVCGLGNRKNRLFTEVLGREGVRVFDSTVRLIEKLKSRGIKVAVVSSSKNCADVLKTAGLAHLFEAKVDGVDSARLGLKGKPDPDIFVRAADDLGVEPKRCVVVEDAVAGVQAGRAGKFGCVIGVDRTGHAEDLKQGGADVVVSDLAEVDVAE
jgi:alpha,alpha-trehalase